MNLEAYPTPETDHAAYYMGRKGPARDAERWCDLLNKSRDLERRLTLARDTLRRTQNGYMRDAQRNLLIDTAILKTNPPKE